RGPKRGRALRAELCTGEVGVTAGRTYRGHPSRAFDAELRSRWILRSAVRADQPCSLTTRRAESTGQPLRYHPETMSADPFGLATPYRTDTCGALRATDVGRQGRLAGWVHRRRDHGHLIFLDLRDRHGITQVVVDRTEQPEAHAAASRLRSEFVVTVDGVVATRIAGTDNAKLPTGAIELRASSVRILSESKTP